MEELLNILTEIHPDVDFENEKRLVDDGILDSFDMVSLIAEIQDVFDVAIDADSITPDVFNSVETIYQCIVKLQEGEA